MPIETERLQTLKARMAEINWYHRIDLGPELGTTPGGSSGDEIRLRYMNLPASFFGSEVIDIGSWDGYFAVEAWRRGASVLATDIWGDFDTPIPNHGDGIRFVLDVLQPHAIRMLTTSVYDLADNIWQHDPDYTADYVIFPGVLYHLTNPLMALESVHKILAPGGLLILETYLDLVTVERPAIALYPHGWANDPTNATGPNPAAVECLLQWAGFREMRFQGGINLPGWPVVEPSNLARGAWHARK